MRRTSSTGTAAAPVTATRSDEWSADARRGCSSSVWYRVGGPGSTDTASVAMRSSTASTSSTAWGSMVAPRNRHARIPALSPKEWKNGLTTR